MDVARIEIRLTPRAGVDAFDRFGPDGVLRARVRAAPVEGAANDALLRLVARTLDVPRTSVRLVGGAQSRRKLVEVEGLTTDQVRAGLAPEAPGICPSASR